MNQGSNPPNYAQDLDLYELWDEMVIFLSARVRLWPWPRSTGANRVCRFGAFLLGAGAWADSGSALLRVARVRVRIAAAMPAKARTEVPANPKTGPLMERLIRERHRVLERIAARTVRPDQVEDAIQAACLGFLRAFDPDVAMGGVDGALAYLARSVDNSAAKIVRGETPRR